ncbi:MAG: hypothetical protein GOVbin3393_21 [Prokaryotic dsDNA virus sp.]|nr:MAG: hypothetical protein GOVbin3393_21 [Prokaryotic dsDNA virus sp.]|tara:strand:+ start:4276 stop:6132 length:1857 start_codon:yes stop_codon:yes gene_type:complete
MKLPRYNSGSGGAPIKVGNNPSGGSGQALAQLGNDMFSALSQYGQQKVRQTAKLRDLDIYNKRSAASTEIEMDMIKFMSTLQTDNDYGSFETKFDTAFKNAVNNATKDRFKGDEYALSKAETDFNLLKVEYFKNTMQKKNEKTISMAQMNYDNNKSNLKKNVDAATSPNQVISLFTTWATDKHKTYADTMYGTGSGEAAQTQYDDALAYANTAYMTQVGKVGAPSVMSPDGKSAMNWAHIASQAANPDFEMKDVNGNVLTVDDPLRKGFIKLARGKADEQKSFFDNRRTELERKDEETFTNRLVNIYAGKPDPDYLTDLEGNKNLQPSTKKALASSFNSATGAGGSATKPWDTQEGLNAQIALRTLVSMGVLDTNKEKMILNSFAARGLIKPELITSLGKEINDHIKNRNTEKKRMFKTVVQTIVKEVGSKDLAEAIAKRNLNDMPNDELMALITSSKDSDLVLQAIENARNLIEEGEKKGISLVNMMGNRNSKNYVVTPIIETYKATKIADIDADLRKVMGGSEFFGSLDGGTFVDETTKFASPNEAFGTGNNYRIDAGVYFKNRSPEIGRFKNVPPMKANESLSDYLNRVDTLIDASGGSMFSGLTLSSNDVIVDQ